jgi:uncharacterized membrane protein YjgN (DUF898 family)
LGYAKIFFVNLALILITFGLYSPWAKVRRLKYLHHNTLVAGSSFEYTARPWAIFKGRMIMIGGFIVFSILSVIPLVNVFFFIGLAVVMPVILRQSYRFRARYTEYRGIKFHFNGTAGSIFLYSILYRFLAILPVGLLVPAALAAERRYLLGELQFGTSRFTARTTAGDFWRVFLSLIGISAVCFLPAFLVIAWRAFVATFFDPPSVPDEAQTLSELVLVVGVLIANVAILTVISPIYQALVGRATWHGATVGDGTLNYTMRLISLLKVALINAVLIICTLGLAHPWCVVRLHRFKMSCLSMTTSLGVDAFVGVQREEIRALGDQALEILDMDIDLGF